MMPENTLFVKGMLFIIILIYSKAFLGMDVQNYFNLLMKFLKSTERVTCTHA